MLCLNLLHWGCVLFYNISESRGGLFGMPKMGCAQLDLAELVLFEEHLDYSCWLSSN